MAMQHSPLLMSKILDRGARVQPREEIVTATTTMLGSEANLLDPTPESCRMIKLDEPIIDNSALEQIRHVDTKNFRPVTIPILFEASAGPDALE